MSSKISKIATVKSTSADAQSIRSHTPGSAIEDADDDDAILRANGHAAAMPRQSNWLSALGLGFSITNSWIGYLVAIPYT